MPGVRLWSHTCVTPTWEEIAEVLELPPDGNFLYFVATGAQERARRTQIRNADGSPVPGTQTDPAKGIVLYFPIALRLLLQNHDYEVARRLDERLAVRRALIRLAGADEDRTRQLLHDVRQWEDALREAASRGIVVDDSDHSILDPEVAHTLGELQGVVAELLDTPIFEAATRAFVTEVAPPACVVLDGFTFLTPLQRLLITTWSETATVDLLVPFRPEQEHGFEAIRNTYADWWKDRTPWPESRVDARTQLAAVKGDMFGNVDATRPPEDDTVRLFEFGNRYQEVESCIREIKRALEDGSLAPEDLAIVALDLAGYRALIAEEAERQGISLSVRASPRQLLLTPPGRFVLALYEAWDTSIEGLRMLPDTFEEMLASAWLGARAQASVDRFRLVRAQAFGTCRGETDWRGALEHLRSLLRGLSAHPQTLRADSREPALALEISDIDLWTEAIELIVRLCSTLFEKGDSPIGDHIGRLLATLDGLPTSDLLDIEREVISALRSALDEQSRAAALEMSAEEFGEILTALAQERDEEAQLRDEEVGETQDQPPDGVIWITTLRGIDGVTRKRIFLLGADDRLMPIPFDQPWPFAEDSIEEHIASERFLFLTILRAAEESLWIWYSRTDTEGSRLPSMYMSLMAKQFDLGLTNPELQELGSEAVPPLPAPIPIKRASYDVTELAQYGLCPFRYRLERLDRKHRAYRAPFQLRLLAGSVWLDLAFSKLEEDHKPYRSRDQLVEAAKDALGKTKRTLRTRFRGLTEQDVSTLERYLGATIERYSIWFKVLRGARALFLSPDGTPGAFSVPIDGRSVEITADGLRHEVRQGRGHWRKGYPIWDDLWRQEWLIPSSQESGEARHVGAVALFETRKEAFDWFKWRALIAYFTDNGHDEFLGRAGELVSALESGEFPRNPGHQCHFCSAQQPCLGQLHPGEVLLEEAATGFDGSVDSASSSAPDLGDLTEQQLKIVERTRTGGVTVVSAGAGAGKTHTMVAAVLDLVERGASIDEFAVITFTNKAADELRARLQLALEGRQAGSSGAMEARRWLGQLERMAGAHIGTIHGFCGDILRNHGYLLPIARSAKRTLSSAAFDEELTAATDDAFAGRTVVESSGLVTGTTPVLARVEWDAHELEGCAKELYEHCHRVGLEIGDLLTATKAQAMDLGKPYRLALAELTADADRRYEERKRDEGRVDAHDLLLRTQELLAGDRGEEIAAGVGQHHHYLFVDEFQDTDPIQADIIRRLEPHLESVLVVGDMKQSLYGFRAAEPGLLAEFAREFHDRRDEDGRPLPLNLARRPTRQLLDIQNAFFNFLGSRGYDELRDPLEAEETPFDPSDPLPPLVVDPGKDSSTVADYIRAMLARQIETRHGIRNAVEPGDIAILARTNRQVERLADEVTRALGGNPRVFDDTGGLFFQRPEIVSTYRVLRLLLEPEDDAVLSLALETPYFDEVESTEAEAALLAAAAAEAQPLTAWFEEEHPDLIDKLQALRYSARRDTVTQVLSHLYDAFEIRDFYTRIGHARALRNLEKLREFARELFREEQALTLRIFVDNLGDRILQQWAEQDAGEEGIAERHPPYVRVMTIHRAKGFEFPIVIIPGLGSRLVNPDHDPPFVVLDDASLDAHMPNTDDIDTRTTQFHSVVDAGRARRIAEEMRVLYVAVTRAQQSVIALGAHPWANGQESEWYSWGDEFRAARDVLEPLGAIYR